MPIDELEALRELFCEEAQVDAESIARLRSRLMESRSARGVSRRSVRRRSVRGPIMGRRTRIVLGAVSLTVLVTIIVASLAASDSSLPPPAVPTSRGTGGTWPRSVPALAPSVVQLVSSGGLQISVPRGWQLDDQTCGTPQADTVLFEDGDAAVASCATREPPRLTVVSFQEMSYLREIGWGKVVKRPVKLGGKWVVEGWLPASRQSARLLVLKAPGIPTVLTIQSPEARSAEHLMATVRLVDSDSNGCVSRVLRLEPPAPAARPGSAGALVPGHPSTASICAYSKGWLFTSTREPQGALGSLVGVINGLPQGSDELANRGQLRKASNCTPEAEDFFVVRFSYQSGPPDLVYVHPNGCAPLPASARPVIPDLSATNGSRSGRITWALIDALHDQYEFPNPDSLKPSPSSK